VGNIRGRFRRSGSRRRWVGWRPLKPFPEPKINHSDNKRMCPAELVTPKNNTIHSITQ
jgi:hypothetical protein